MKSRVLCPVLTTLFAVLLFTLSVSLLEGSRSVSQLKSLAGAFISVEVVNNVTSKSITTRSANQTWFPAAPVDKKEVLTKQQQQQQQQAQYPHRYDYQNKTSGSPFERFSNGRIQLQNFLYKKKFWMVVSPTRHLLVNSLPKVMSSSVKDALNMIECCPKGYEKHLQEDNWKCNYRCAEPRKSKRFSATDVTKYNRVIILRDPFERLYSAYRDSDHNPHIWLETCKDTAQCTFEEWVDEMAADPEAALQNEHFRQQATMTQFGQGMQYNYYLRMSSNVDMEYFWKNLVQFELHHNTAASHRRLKSNRAVEFYKTLPFDTVQKVATLYHRDVALWKKLLQVGTPKFDEDQEYTVYDWYIEEKERRGL